MLGNIQSGWTYHTIFSFSMAFSLSYGRIRHGLTWHGIESYTVCGTCFRVDKLTSEHILKKTATSSGVISILTVSPPSSSPMFIVCDMCDMSVIALCCQGQMIELSDNRSNSIAFY